MEQDWETEEEERQGRRALSYTRVHFAADLRDRTIELNCEDGRGCLVPAHMVVVEADGTVVPPPQKKTAEETLAERDAAIMECFNYGEGPKEIARRFSLSARRISQIRKAAKPPEPPQEPSDERRSRGDLLDLIISRMPHPDRLTGFQTHSDGSVDVVYDETKFRVHADLRVTAESELQAAMVQSILGYGE